MYLQLLLMMLFFSPVRAVPTGLNKKSSEDVFTQLRADSEVDVTALLAAKYDPVQVPIDDDEIEDNHTTSQEEGDHLVHNVTEQHQHWPSHLPGYKYHQEPEQCTEVNYTLPTYGLPRILVDELDNINYRFCTHYLKDTQATSEDHYEMITLQVHGFLMAGAEHFGKEIDHLKNIDPYEHDARLINIFSNELQQRLNVLQKHHDLMMGLYVKGNFLPNFTIPQVLIDKFPGETSAENLVVEYNPILCNRFRIVVEVCAFVNPLKKADNMTKAWQWTKGALAAFFDGLLLAIRYSMLLFAGCIALFMLFMTIAGTYVLFNASFVLCIKSILTFTASVQRLFARATRAIKQ